MAAEMLSLVFYEAVLPNSAVGALFIVFIFVFRKFTKRLSKGYVRILWLLLFAELLAPPLFHGSFQTLRDLAMNAKIIQEGKLAADSLRQGGTESQNGLLQGNLQPDGWKDGTMSMEDGARPDGTGGLSEKDLAAAGRFSAKGQLSDEGASEAEKRYADTGLPWIRRAVSTERLSLVMTAAAAVWMTGVIVFCTVYIRGFLKLKKRVSDAVFVSGEGYWVTGQTDTPFVLPHIPPRIYLPVGLAYEKRKDILAHERQHMKNLDIPIKCLSVFTAAVHWFNPFVWAACVSIGKDLEMYCDECVLKGCGMEERRRYSSTLLEFAAESNGLTLTMHFGESNTEDRIRHILFLKKPRAAVSVLLSVLLAAAGIFFLTSQSTMGNGKDTGINAEAESNAEGKTGLYSIRDAEAFLAKKIRFRTDQPLLKQYCADFDGDGSMELFAVTGAANEIGANEIWFASAQEVKCLMDDGERYLAFYEDEKGVYEVSGSQKLFLMNCGTTGSVYFSKCFYVKSGRVLEAETYENLLEQEEGADFKVYVDAYDLIVTDSVMSGHTRKAYYVKWTGTEFEEYPAKEIPVEELQKYKGAEEVLGRIAASDYTVSSVFLRENGVININVAQDFDAGSVYENVTLKLEGDTVTVADHTQEAQAETETGSETGSDIIASSYGGIYQASAFGVSWKLPDEKTLFAEKIVRLVKESRKEMLAECIRYPIRVDAGGAEMEIKNAEEFVRNYDRIANDAWKERVLAADTAHIAGNYMGYWIGDGAVWFEMQEGTWGCIFAINNRQGQPKENAKEADTKEAWQQLALSHGMTLEESQAWYDRFLEDALYVDQYNYKITGCAYTDFDGNGTKDLFVVTSLSPHEIYPQTLEWTAYVYGYMNGSPAYTKGLDAFSQDGFWQCGLVQGEDENNSNHCRICYTVDTDSAEELTFFLDLDTEGRVVREESIPVKTEDAQALKHLMKNFYEAYFAGDEKALRACLRRDFNGNVTVYDRPQEADQTDIRGVKGLDTVLSHTSFDKCSLSLEFRYPDEDSYTYLTVSFVKEEGEWKAESYGLEK